MRGDGLQAQGLDATRRQLDRQGDAVEFAAQLRGQQRVAVLQLETRAAGGCAFHEQLHGGIGQRRPGGGAFARRGKGQRRQAVDELALGTQRLAAGG
ncbi:hypothetical protein D3C87_1405590 [compost metagenome]